MEIILIIICFLISSMSSTIGAISGIGGGVIMKPVLDLTGMMDVTQVSFLSGCTVLAMAVVSLIRSKGNGVQLDTKIATNLAIGAAAGGVIGKLIFDLISKSFGNDNLLGLIQAILLLLITVGVFVYIKNKSKITTYNVQNILACLLIGLSLGLISAFLGIGGGPINIAVLYFFFSMDSKKAAKNSIYVIMFSQLTSFISTLTTGSVPEFNAIALGLMVFGGILGALVGSKISKKIDADGVEKIFTILLFIIIFINIYNIVKFSMAL